MHEFQHSMLWGRSTQSSTCPDRSPKGSPRLGGTIQSHPCPSTLRGDGRTSRAAAGAGQRCWTSPSAGLAGRAGAASRGEGTLSAVGLGTGSRGGGTGHPLRHAPQRAPGRSYLGALAGAADVVAHPGRLVHAGAGGRAAKLGFGHGSPRSGGEGMAAGRAGRAVPAAGLSPLAGTVTRRWDCHPAPGLSPRTATLPPSAGVCALAALPACRLQNKTRNTPSRPRHRFPPPPSKAEARRARLCPPPALRGRRRSGESGEGEPGSAPLGSAPTPGSRSWARLRPRHRSLLPNPLI